MRTTTSARRRAALTAVATGAALAVSAAPALAVDPTAVTSPIDPTLTTDSYALLGGVVNPNGVAAVSYFFQWGTTTAYGESTPVTPTGAGKAEVPVDFALDTLKPQTTYHYRLVVVEPNGAAPNGVTEIDGADQAFTTTPALALAADSAKAKVKGTVVSVPVKVVGPPDETADGLLSLRGTVKGKTVSLGSGTYSLTSGAKGVVKVRLNSTGLAARKQAKAGRLAVTASAKTKSVNAPSTWKLTLG